MISQPSPLDVVIKKKVKVHEIPRCPSRSQKRGGRVKWYCNPPKSHWWKWWNRQKWKDVKGSDRTKVPFRYLRPAKMTQLIRVLRVLRQMLLNDARWHWEDWINCWAIFLVDLQRATLFVELEFEFLVKQMCSTYFAHVCHTCLQICEICLDMVAMISLSQWQISRYIWGKYG